MNKDQLKQLEADLWSAAVSRRAFSLCVAVLLPCGLAWSINTCAQDYPIRPVRLIVASSPGSGVDIVARIVAQRMSEAMGTQMVVDNRAGGGG